MFVNNNLLKCFSKHHNKVNSSMFVSELVALRIERSMIMEIRIKLKMFGVPLAGPENLLCDNNGVVKNTIIPESTLSKNQNTINYYYVCEASASGIMRIRK